MRSGLPHAHTYVRGRTDRVPFVLEHRPLYNNYRFATVRTKWKRLAPIHARFYLMRWQDIPQFGYAPGTEWPLRRKVGNVLSPLLIVPYGIAEFVADAWWLRRMRPFRQVLRISAYWGLNSMMVTAYVAKFMYFERSAGRLPEGVTPVHYPVE
jgi:hypothetical protein